MACDNLVPETLYKRLVHSSGAVRYTPIGALWPGDYFTEGVYVLRVNPGVKSIVSVVEPPRAEVAAAIEEARDAMQAKLSELLRAMPTETSSSDIERKAYQQYEKTFIDAGLDPYPMRLSMGSVYDIIDAAIDLLREKMVKAEGE